MSDPWEDGSFGTGATAPSDNGEDEWDADDEGIGAGDEDGFDDPDDPDELDDDWDDES